jgi:hypothetical protein
MARIGVVAHQVDYADTDPVRFPRLRQRAPRLSVGPTGQDRLSAAVCPRGRGRHRRRPRGAHASLVASEYGIPAVVAGDRQVVTVCGGGAGVMRV